jgi:hypothetical protein
LFEAIHERKQCTPGPMRGKGGRGLILVSCREARDYGSVGQKFRRDYE